MARFHLTNLPRSYQLTQQIWYLQQGSSDLSTYYTKLKILWDDLDGADCVKTCQSCACACCKATAAKIEHTKVIKFLASLNESYSNARSQIIMKKTVPDLSEVYNLLDQDFNQRSITTIQNASAFQMTSTETFHAVVNATYNTRPFRPICSHCGYNGHTIDKCYKIHGYPPGFKHKKPQDGKASSTGAVKPVVAQLTVNATQQNVSEMMNPLSKDQIQGMIDYFNTHLNQTQNQNQTSAASTSTGTITALPGMALSSYTIGFIGMFRAT